MKDSYDIKPPNTNKNGKYDSQNSNVISFDEVEDELLVIKLNRKIPFLSVILVLLTSVCFCSCGMTVKLIESIHGVQVAFFKACVSLITNFVIILVRRLDWFPVRNERTLVFVRCIIGSISVTLWYFALKLPIPFGDATTIRFTLPIWTLILGFFFLNESITCRKVIACIVALLGVVLVVQPQSLFDWLNSLTDSQDNKVISTDIGQEDISGRLLGALLAIISSITLASSLTLLRLCKKTPAEVIIMWLSVFSALIAVLVVVTFDTLKLPDNSKDWGLVVLNGLLATLGQVLFTNALKIEQSGVCSVLRSFDIVVAFFYGIVLLDEEIKLLSIIGAIFVCAGVIIVVSHNKNTDKK